jgi:glutathione S-transferase
MIKLYDYVVSSDGYKVRLLLSMLRVEFTTVKVNFHPAAEHRQPDFLALNPLGSLPVLTDGDLVLRGALPILGYLAQTHDPERRWFPTDARKAASVLMWLDFAERVLRPVSDAHMLNFANHDEDTSALAEAGEAALMILEDHLAKGEIEGRPWAATDDPTIADLALFPPAALAPEADIALDTKPALWRWLDRVKRLPNFIVMPGVLPLLGWPPQADQR